VAGTAAYDIPDKTVMLLDVVVSTNDGTTDQLDRYITPMSRSDYASISSKFVEGFPTGYWFDRIINSQIKLWPVPDSGGPYVINYNAAVQLQDANTASGETPSVPYRWYDVVVSGLAWRLARVYMPAAAAQMKMDFDVAWKIAAENDTESVNLKLSLDIGAYYG
jgi:hypothetical protein